MEWPPRSGLRATFPEIDRVAWFDLREARDKLKQAQVPFLDRLAAALGLAEDDEDDPDPAEDDPTDLGRIEASPPEAS